MEISDQKNIRYWIDSYKGKPIRNILFIGDPLFNMREPSIDAPVLHELLMNNTKFDIIELSNNTAFRKNVNQSYHVDKYETLNIIKALGYEKNKTFKYQYDFVFISYQIHLDALAHHFISKFSKNVIDLSIGQNVSTLPPEFIFGIIGIRVINGLSYWVKLYGICRINDILHIKKYIINSAGPIIYEIRPYFNKEFCKDDGKFNELWVLLMQFAQRGQIHGEIIEHFLPTNQTFDNDDNLIESDIIYHMLTSDFYIWDVNSTTLKEYQFGLACVDKTLSLKDMILKDLNDVIKYFKENSSHLPSKRQIEEYCNILLQSIGDSSEFNDISPIIGEFVDSYES